MATLQKRKPKSRKNRRQPITAWLKARVSTYDHCPGEYDDKAGKIVPKHRITNLQAMARINGDLWLSGLNNELIGRLINGEVRYASGNLIKLQDNLACVDVDCHGSGTPEDAFEFLNHASTVLGQPIFSEPSTNKTGAHGYVLINREGDTAAGVNDGLLSLELFLERLRRMGRPDGRPWNITGVEVKGSCSKARWDAQGRCVGYTAGSLMKLPMTFLDSPEREEELRNTARLSLTELGALHRRIVPNYLRDACTQEAPLSTNGQGTRSTKNHPIKRSEIERITSTYSIAAHRLFPEILRCKGKSRHVAIRVDQAIYLCVVAYCTDTQGEDKAMPSWRIYSIWKAMYDAKEVDRAPDHGRIAAMRNHLSDQGHIEWTEHRFWTPDKEDFRPDETIKGICCKYSLSRKLMVQFGFMSFSRQRDHREHKRKEDPVPPHPEPRLRR